MQGGTATIALIQSAGQFDAIFPLTSFDQAQGANLEDSEYLMYRPVYWFGGPNSVGLDEEHSIGNPPVVTNSGNTTTATIQLKPYRWSDGKPVTSRDVEFWFNILKAEKNNWWDYVPGQFPDSVSAFKIITPTKFSLTFKGNYSSSWLYNELGQLVPIPQHAWDKESATGPIGNWDQTTAGAQAVYKYIEGQSNHTASYATNPLWQVVDGPWKLSAYTPSTGDATYVRNTKYSGPAPGSLHAIKILSYASDTAEFDALLASGGISYGYIPFNDAAQVSRVTSDGYQVQAWPTWGITYITLNFASPQVGPILKQLYIRAAMQQLINQGSYIHAFLDGYGNPTYGPVPLVPDSSKFVSSQQKQNPYPYNPTAATASLKAHGWKIVSGGPDVCVRPGPGSTQCGPGIPSGAKLSLSLLYATGSPAVDEEVAALQSAFGQAGIQLTLHGASYDSVVGDDAPCSKSSCWQMNYYGSGWYFDPTYNEPDGSAIFNSTGSSNAGAYNSPAADSLMGKLPSGGLDALYNYQNYLSKQLPVLWMPQLDYQISAVNNKLKGVYPQDPDTNIYPENWYFVK